MASTIAGVMPPGFGSFYGERLDLWQPVDPASARYSERQDHWLMAIGRLKPRVSRAPGAGRDGCDCPPAGAGVSRDQQRRGRKGYTLARVIDGGAARYLYPLLGAVVFVLLIACANAANLMQSRAETHRKEFALRASLGAGRGRLMQQLFVESALMGVLAGAFGVALTLLGIQVFRALAGDFPNI